ncbi:FAA hydrolase family protein [Halorubrum sp. CGM5_25_10-8B]|uniref:fumarylacetoacetate hydrolase family protein n=1 Tax=Halorubrum sp. CGM5_25_10-8B TaxID=2518115 RepID=UPI0010F83336|nr:fumarylacetoacetate hydrolase family protein [Halorubrum sp. CGM5_25_10-8B]TKX39421.1 FAA hydrolase family protein [Halorubrum sp. CGM5_25_10-8B]
MKLVRFSPRSESTTVHTGIVRDDEIVQVEVVPGADDGASFGTALASVTTEDAELSDRIEEGDVFERSEVTLRAPISNAGRLFCFGGVYTGHLRDAGLELTVDPNQWIIPDNAIVGPEETIVLPSRVAGNVKPAAELCIVIGRAGKYIEPSEAYNHIAGYSISNDVTARTEWPGPMAYKMMDTFSPIGPHVTTVDEVDQPMNLNIVMRQDGDVICQGNTSGMRFSLSFLVSYLSTITELQPGDVISTGDPGGIEGSLQPGSTVAIEIEDVGELKNPVRLESSQSAKSN